MQVNKKGFRPADQARPRYSPLKLNTLGRLTPIQLAMVQSGTVDPRVLLDKFIDQHYPDHSKSSTTTSTR